MIQTILFLLDKIEYRSKNLDRARGRYKYPENWSEFIRYIKFKYSTK